MVIREGDNSAAIEVVDRVPPNLPSSGGVELSIEVSPNGFSGHAFAWIDATALEAFVRELRRLEDRRQGAASLEGMSPGLFHFRIWSIDRRGHMALSGFITTYRHHDDVLKYRHALEFGFEFDPTLLPRVLSGFQHMADGES